MAGEYVSTERLRRALRTMARIVAAPGGDKYAPLFERLESELAARQRTSDTVERARQLIKGARQRDGVSA